MYIRYYKVDIKGGRIMIFKNQQMLESLSQICLSEFAPVEPGSYVRRLPAIGAGVPLEDGLVAPHPLPASASPDQRLSRSRSRLSSNLMTWDLVHYGLNALKQELLILNFR